MVKGRDEIDWAPRVPKHKIRRLYESDARGLLDEELLDEVGIALYLRCQSILQVHDAQNGRVMCPRCAAQQRVSIIERPPRHGDIRDVVLTCPICDWTITWGAYHASFKRRQLNAGGAVGAFRHYVRHYPQARTPQAKMLAVDQLIREFHYSLARLPDLPTRPVGVNLIEGQLTDVVMFLDDLSFGEDVGAERQAIRLKWQNTLQTWRDAVSSWQERDDEND